MTRRMPRFAETLLPPLPFARRIIGLVLCLSAFILFAAAQETMPPADVLLDGQPLFTIHWGFGNNTPAARAVGIEKRLKSLAEDASVPLDLTVQHGELTVDIRCDNVILASVYSSDGMAENTSAEDLAARWSAEMQDGLHDYREKYGWRLALYHSTLSLGGIVLCVLAFVLLNRYRERLIAGAAALFAARAEGSRIQVASRLSVMLRDSIARRVLALLHLALAAAIVALALHMLLVLFPATRPLTVSVYDSMAAFSGSLLRSFWVSLPALLFILILVVLLWQLLRLVYFFFGKVGERSITIQGFRPRWSLVTGRLINIAVVLLAVLIAYPYIPGAESPAFKGISLFIGVLVSLGSSGLVANIISGVMLTYMDAFESGDLVKIGDVVAFVKDTSLLTTRLITRHNETITMPNSFILDKQVVNYSTRKGGDESAPLISTKVGIGFEVPWRQVEAMLLEAAARTESVITDPAPFVILPAFESFSASYELNAYTRPGVRRYIAITELNHNVLDVFNEYGISLLTPSYMTDPAQDKLVARDAWFTEPASREQTPRPPVRKYPPGNL